MFSNVYLLLFFWATIEKILFFSEQPQLSDILTFSPLFIRNKFTWPFENMITFFTGIISLSRMRSALLRFFSPPPPQVDHFGRRRGGYLRHFRLVLHPRELRPLPHPGARDQGQAPAVCQRGQPFSLLGGQFLLGHGMDEYGRSLWGNMCVSHFLCSLSYSVIISPFRLTTFSALHWWLAFSWLLTKSATHHHPTCQH